MQDSKGQDETKRLRAKLSSVIILQAVLVWIILLCAGGSEGKREPVESVSHIVTEVTTVALTEPTTYPEEIDTTIAVSEDPNNRVYPYSSMSSDWGAEIYEEGYTYYEIPRSYVIKGGMFPEVAQVYLWNLCRDVGVDYYTVLALIEYESGYRYYATGDNGRSKGLMQIQEKWHTGRMKALGVKDLYDPYSNMRVGVDYLKELQDKYNGDHKVLMAYNMGGSGAKKLWDKGVYSTTYSKSILQRAQELKQELQDH